MFFTKQRTARGETWRREFANRGFSSRLRAPGPGRVREVFGPTEFELLLDVCDAALRLRLLRLLRGWRFALPLPRGLLPIVDATEWVRGGRFCFDISLRAPLSRGLIVRNRGSLRPDGGLPDRGATPANVDGRFEQPLLS